MEYITTTRYAENVDARCPNELHEHLLPLNVLPRIATGFIRFAEGIHECRRALFYGKLSDDCMELVAGITTMNGEVGLGVKLDRNEQNLMHAILGIASEAGELMEAMVSAFAAKQKGVEDGFDHINVRKELGDVLWYVQLGLNAIHSNMDECMTINDNKLEKRYGPAFSSDKANERYLDAERKELEK